MTKPAFAWIFVVSSFLSGAAGAVPITMTTSSNNLMTVHFTAPAQPAFHNSIQFYVQTYSYPSAASFNAAVSLSDENGALASGTQNSTFLGGWFTSPGSAYSGNGLAIDFNFGPIADGVTSGIFTYQLLSSSPGAAFSFDTADVRVQTHGNGGGFPAFFPTITQVTISTGAAAVPVGGTLVLLLLGVLGFGVRGRK